MWRFFFRNFFFFFIDFSSFNQNFLINIVGLKLSYSFFLKKKKFFVSSCENLKAVRR